MDKYINQKLAIKRFEEIKAKDLSLRDTVYLDGVISVIENLPSADVVPVVHAKWEFPIFLDGDANDPRCKCSECGSIETPLARHKFCPNCGARMDL